jgi:uncharacterized protein (TIGR02145 family)
VLNFCVKSEMRLRRNQSAVLLVEGRSLPLNVLMLLLNVIGIALLVLGFHPAYKEVNWFIEGGAFLIVGSIVGLFALRGLILFSYLARIVVASSFLLSGWIIALEPNVFALKSASYLDAAFLESFASKFNSVDGFSFTAFKDYTLFFAILVSVFQLVIGVLILFGINIKSTYRLAFVFVLFSIGFNAYSKFCQTSNTGTAQVETIDELTLKSTTHLSSCPIDDASILAAPNSFVPYFTVHDLFVKELVIGFFVFVMFIMQFFVFGHTLRDNWYIGLFSILLILASLFYFGIYVSGSIAIITILVTHWIRYYGALFFRNDKSVVVFSFLLAFVPVVFSIKDYSSSDKSSFVVDNQITASDDNTDKSTTHVENIDVNNVDAQIRNEDVVNNIDIEKDTLYVEKDFEWVVFNTRELIVRLSQNEEFIAANKNRLQSTQQEIAQDKQPEKVIEHVAVVEEPVVEEPVKEKVVVKEIDKKVYEENDFTRYFKGLSQKESLVGEYVSSIYQGIGEVITNSTKVLAKSTHQFMKSIAVQEIQIVEEVSNELNENPVVAIDTVNTIENQVAQVDPVVKPDEKPKEELPPVEKVEPPKPDIKEISSAATSDITTNSAVIKSLVVNSDPKRVTERGVVYGESPNPTVQDEVVKSGSGIGKYTSKLVGLKESTTYYARAYNKVDGEILYGNELKFKTLTPKPKPEVFSNTVVDVEGNSYRAIKFDNGHVWMADNLKTSTYSNGDPIPQIEGNSEWQNATTGAWSNYSNSSQYNNPYGKLYNWYVVQDSRNVCPKGWRVPTDADWLALFNQLGGANAAGGKLKLSGTSNWKPPNMDGSNSSGFNGLPGGTRNSVGAFSKIGTEGMYWSASSAGSSDAIIKTLSFFHGVAGSGSAPKSSGMSVRCMKVLQQ